MNRYSDFVEPRRNLHLPSWKPSEFCATGCGFKRADDYGFCWIHKTEFVVMTYRPGRFDALPIKVELRRRMAAYDYSERVMAEVLDVGWRRLTRLLHPMRVWTRHQEADLWFTRLQLDPPAMFWEAV